MPQNLPANFTDWDDAPKSLPADFNQWDDALPAPKPLWTKKFGDVPLLTDEPMPVKLAGSYQIQASEPEPAKPAGPPLISTRRILRQKPALPGSMQPSAIQKAADLVEGVPVAGPLLTAPLRLAGVTPAAPKPAQVYEGDGRRVEVGADWRPTGTAGEVADDVRSVRDNLLRQSFGLGDAIEEADVPWYLGGDATKGAAKAASGLVDSPEALMTLGVVPAAFHAAKGGGVVPRAAVTAAELEFAKGAVESGLEAAQDPNKSFLQKAGEVGAHALFAGGMVAGAGRTMRPEIDTARRAVDDVARDQNAKAQGLPFASPEPTPVQRAVADIRQLDPAERWQDRLSAMSDDDLLATRAGEDNPFRRGMVATEIKRREKLNVWRPTVEAPPQPANRATRRESVAVPEPDLQLVADELGLGKFEDLSLEDQAAVRGVRDEAAGLTRGPSVRPAEPVTAPAVRPMPPPLEMPPWLEYRDMQAGVQRGLGNIDAIRELRDEAARQPVEADPFVMKPAAESAEVFQNEPPKYTADADSASAGEGRAAGSEGRGEGSVVPTSERFALANDENAPTFYSQLERSVEEKLPEQAQPLHIRGILNNPQNRIKADEMRWSGLDQWLTDQGGRKVSKAEVLDYLRQNRVEIREVTHGKAVDGEVAQATAKWLEDEGYLEYWPDYLNDFELTGTPLEISRRAAGGDRNAMEMLQGLNVPSEYLKRLRGVERGSPKFEEYQVPGGENYRELLLTLPQSVRAGDYKSSHWSEPNVLAHVRFNERTVDGKRTLFVEEIQSDWHQDGRKKGYKDPTASEDGWVVSTHNLRGARERQTYRIHDADGRLVYDSDLANETNLIDKETDARALARQYLNDANKGVPSAPFAKTWHELAFKRMLRYAAENGYDRIAWTDGETQAGRYDLSKQVDLITINRHTEDGGGFQIKAEKDGTIVIPLRDAKTVSDLADLVGKDLAEKAAQLGPTEEKTYSGLDLKVGGEGMKGFYDKILPDYANKYGKKWGARVEATKLESGEVAHSMPVTPEMRRSVLQEGQPMFAVRPESTGEARIGKPDIQRAFGNKAEVSELQDGTYRVTRNGFEVNVHPNLDYIEINPETVRRDYGRDPQPGERAAGRYVRIDRAGLIQLAKRGGDGAILDHEVFHAAMDLALTPHEKAGVLKRYGTEEAAAEAYSTLKADAPAGVWFAKIRAYFQRMVDAVTGRAEGTLRKVARGDVWEGAGSETTPTERYALAHNPLGLFEPEPPGKGPRLAEAAEPVKPKRELVISPNADESVVKLVEKSGLSEDGKIDLWASIDRYMADNPQRKVMSDAEYRDLANKVDPGNVWAIDPSKITRDNLPSREVMEAAVNMKDVVQQELVEKTMEAATQPENTPVEVKEARVAEINRLNEDLSQLLDIIIPVRSEHGRNLRMWRTMAAQGLDPAYWIARARRTAKLPANVALPGDAETKIKDTLTETQAAENEAMDQVTAIDRGKQKIREGVEKAKAKAKPAVELSREERIEQARKQAIKRLQAELNGKRITDTLTPEERALIADDPEVKELRERVHELRAKGRPVKSADELVAAEIARERTRLSKVLEGEPVTARVDKLTPEQRKLVDADPGLQSLKARIREQRAQDQMKRRNAAVPDEHKIERAAGLEMDKLERKGEALAETPVERPKSKWDLTPEQRAQVDRDPRVIASRRKLASLMADLQKSTKWEAVMAFRRANMLSALVTHGRNWIGNTTFQLSEEAARIPSSIVDAVLSNFPTSEGRTVEGVNAKAVVRALDEMRTRGHREAKQIMRHGTSDADLMKANPEFARSLNSGSEVLNAYVNTVLRSMSAADRYFRVYAYERSIGEQMRLAGVERPTAAMETRAIADAEYATFNGKNKVSDAIYWAKRSSPEAAAAVDLVVPFVKTPTNVALRALDYTPLGLLRGVNAARKAIGGKSLTPEYQRAISQSIGRATVGSALMLLGYKWAEDRVMTGNRPDNPSEARGDEVAGQSWGSRKAFGRWWRTSSMAPVGTLLVVGAALYEASHQREAAGMSDDDKWWQGFWSVGGTALRAIADQPMVQGADMMKRVVDKPKNSLPYMVGSMVSSFVPGSSAVSGIAAAFDNKRRETRADNPMESAVNVVAARIPGWRNTLPEKVDALGQTVPQNRFQGIDPFSSQDAKEGDDVAQALAAEDISFGRPTKIKGESDEAYRWRLRVHGAAQRRAIETVVRSDAYKRAGAMKDGSDERLELIRDARKQGANTGKAMTGAKWYKNWTNEQRLDVLRRSFETLTRK